MGIRQVGPKASGHLLGMAPSGHSLGTAPSGHLLGTAPAGIHGGMPLPGAATAGDVPFFDDLAVAEGEEAVVEVGGHAAV